MIRQPIYLLIDSSGSMYGEPIESVNKGIRTMLDVLRKDPQALETVLLSVVSFDKEVKEIFPLTELAEIRFEDIEAHSSGATHMGEALKYLVNRYDEDIASKINRDERTFFPIVFVLTDGKPSDLQLFEEMVIKLKSLKFASIVGCAAGPKAKTEYLSKFSNSVISLESADAKMVSAYFKWISEFIESPITTSISQKFYI